MKGIDLTAPFRQLIERKLWPVAVALLAGVAAMPLLLAKDGAPPPPPAAAAAAAQAATAQAAAAQPVVAMADEAATEDRRKVLGSRKDPFRPAKGPALAKVDAGQAVTATTTAPQSESGSKPDTPSSGGSSSPVPPVTVPGVPAEPPKVYELYSLMVRFGDSTADRLPKSNLKRLKPMPDAEEPAVIYLGLLKDRRTAVFLVDAGVKVQGDGRCVPSSSSCQTVHLRAGETAFFDVTDDKGNVTAQYQLDVVKVIRKRTTDAAAAARARSATAKGGRSALRSRVSRVGKHRYDARSGYVRHGE